MFEDHSNEGGFGWQGPIMQVKVCLCFDGDSFKLKLSFCPKT